MTLTLKPATELLQLLQRREISISELAEAHVAQIERLNPALNAITDFDAERVRFEARQLEMASKCGERLGPLHGLPMTIKSSISVRGMRCEIGSRLYRDNRPTEDAAAVARLRAAGALILGTTNCPEFLMAYESANTLHGATSNPWDLARSAGGSSGGEAAAIAAGMSAAGLGSDSGGSVRQPAHVTGICALKPTSGRVPARGHLPPCVGPFSTIGALGPMARTIGDLKLLFRVLATPMKSEQMVDPLDATSAATTVDEQMLTTPNFAELRTTTIGYFEDDGLIPVTAETRAAVQSAALALKEAGFAVRPWRPKFLEPLRQLWWKLFVQCGAMFYEPTIRGRREELSPIFSEFLATAEALPPLTPAELLAAWAELDTLRSAALAEWRGFAENAMLLCPVAAVPAFKHDERAWQVEGQTVRYLDETRFTQWFNVLAAPAVVLPVGSSSEGLPIGVQLVALPHRDEQALAVAEILERSFGFHAPPMAR